MLNWRKQHKYSGIAASLLVLIFSVSGIILNHRQGMAHVDISRKWLPSRYEFKNWNGGLMRGTLACDSKLLIYGINGIWIAEADGSDVTDFNAGLPEGADYRQVRGIAIRDGIPHAATPFGVYALSGNKWRELPVSLDEDERITDITAKGDSLVVTGRSHLYISTRPDTSFQRLRLASSPEQDGKVTLFRSVWMLHSGELFGTVGKFTADAIAGVLALLSVTGLIYWLLPYRIRTRKRRKADTKRSVKALRTAMRLHNTTGVATFVFTLLIVITGWCLRPPVMIPLAMTRTAPMPGTAMSSPNTWHDKLRMLRYDNASGDWLLSTADGFYSLPALTDTPRKLDGTPPVSVMGLNVLEQTADGTWLCGSFAGMYRWDRAGGKATDYFTGEDAPQSAGPPFGKFAVSGYSPSLNTVAEYYEGTTAIPQPEELDRLPMSAWAAALEAHSGRLFIGSVATYIFIFITGFVIAWCIISGWKVRHPHALRIRRKR